ncbi:MAG TPA: glycosyl hydrolase family 18 protein [Candidatus Binatia bacterium]|nr:glycosyl hydrolase family 18 protein [Candidatus Binatia bacterium]
MSGRARVIVPLAVAAAVAVGAFALMGSLAPPPRNGLPTPTPPDTAATQGPPLPEPSPTPRPGLGGTELYGYLPYWQMNGAVAEHLRSTPVTTLALFSVSARRNGSLNPNPTGYRRITSDVGRRLIREAHDRGARVELVFTSFGPVRNGRFFGRLPGSGATPAPGGTAIASTDSTASPAPTPPPWQRTVRELVDLAVELGVDGINVDVERLDPLDRGAYGAFLTALRAALREARADAQVSVATEAGERGVANAAVAAAAGVDRIFLMGYDYHWSGSPPGASAPVDRLDGIATLRWSIERYVEAGVPRDRIFLGLPLYGMRWRTLGPDRFSPVVGDGIAWLPNENLETLTDPAFASTHDPVEVAEWFAVEDGDEWLITYYDTPATLRSKLALARDQGLAGGGFWALGYTRGLPGYGDLMDAFVSGDVAREEAPPPP